MRYMGGKNKIAKQLAMVMKPYIDYTNKYIEPFCGSAKVVEQVANIVDENVELFAYDINEYLITLFLSLQEGWQPPKVLTEETYKTLRANPDLDKPLAAFAGFGCSWGGKWFGGYAKCSRKEDFAMETHNSLLKQKDKLKNVVFGCKDYKDLNPENAVIYCDPPYANTTKYNINTHFNSEVFWNKMREWSQNNIVFISEFNAPDDFECIWQNKVRTEIRDAKNERRERIEKLFVYKDSKTKLERLVK